MKGQVSLPQKATGTILVLLTTFLIPKKRSEYSELHKRKQTPNLISS
jgi:hypothetical protein